MPIRKAEVEWKGNFIEGTGRLGGGEVRDLLAVSL